MSDEGEIELEALRSLYFQQDELIVVEGSSGKFITVYLDINGLNYIKKNNCDFTNGSKGKLTFFLSNSYPISSIEQVTIENKALSRDVLLKIQQNLDEKLSDSREFSALELCSLTQELLENAAAAYSSPLKLKECDSGHAQDFQDCSKSATDVDYRNKNHLSCSSESPVLVSDISQSVPVVHNALLHLDHMRSVQSYTKLIKKWVVELGLGGRLLFAHKFILILLQGHSLDIKEYVIRNRTTNVDVDSRGRSCKERMLTVLCDVPNKQATKLCNFEVHKGPLSQNDLEKLFISFGLEDMYTKFVKTIR